MRIVNRIVLGALCAVGMVACDQANILGPEPTDELVPLAVGNSWSMEFTIETPAGSQVENVRFEVSEEIVVQNESWFKVENTGEYKSHVFADGYYANRPGGLWTLKSLPGERLRADIMFQFPADTLGVNSFTSDVATELIQSGVQQQTANGDWLTTYHYVTELRGFGEDPVLYNVYFAAGVGIVSMEGGIPSRSELLRRPEFTSAPEFSWNLISFDRSP